LLKRGGDQTRERNLNPGKGGGLRRKNISQSKRDSTKQGPSNVKYWKERYAVKRSIQQKNVSFRAVGKGRFKRGGGKRQVDARKTGAEEHWSPVSTGLTHRTEYYS